MLIQQTLRPYLLRFPRWSQHGVGKEPCTGRTGACVLVTALPMWPWAGHQPPWVSASASFRTRKEHGLESPLVWSPALPLVLDRSLQQSGLSCLLWKPGPQWTCYQAVVRIKHGDVQIACFLAGTPDFLCLLGAFRAQDPSLSWDHSPPCLAQVGARHIVGAQQTLVEMNWLFGKQSSSKRNKNIHPLENHV